jgi:16S rRNA (adenine1518-N6/adenine1519-N6)-dimethyltransferase
MIKPKKSLGQNFLIDKNIIKKIINIVDIETKNVIEIGPGSGNLTKEILQKKPKELVVIEKDSKLCDLLKEKFVANKSLKIFNNDILNFQIEDKIKKIAIIFGNLPYYISSQILVKLIRLSKWPPDYKFLILMFQKEVADRIVAKDKNSNYGRLAIIASWRLKVKSSFNISKNCFYPKPKVDSSLLIFEPRMSKKYKINDLKNLETLTQIFFSNKRKMINKPLKKIFKDIDLIKNKLNLNLSDRPEDLAKEKYYQMTEYYEKNKI